MKDPRFAKFVVLVNGLTPLAILCWDTATGRAGANPTENAIHTTGVLALTFLLLSLAVTPARKITGYNFLSHFRRMLGLFAFFYGVLHLGTYFVFDRSLSLGGMLSDVASKPFILLGMAALLLMAPLAATSTNAMIKRLGANRWKWLHRLVYPAAVLAATHFWMSKKSDKSQPMAFALVLVVLLGYRLIALLRKRVGSTNTASVPRAARA